jgi:citrate lyase beta subunit
MLLRSLLFVPGSRPDRFAKARGAGSDAVVFDLEDAVDAARKSEAREAVGAFLASSASSGSHRIVRLNQPGSRWFEDDRRWIAGLTGCDGIMIPKIESAAAIALVAAAAAGRPLLAMLETPPAILRADAIIAGSPPLLGICLGAEDLTASLGVPRTTGGQEILVARSLVALAAAAAGLLAIDAVYTGVSALDDLAEDARRARALGFTGKMAIHPAQVPVINSVFTPTPDEIASARRIMDADASARTRGEGVTRLDDRMIDAPVVTRARRIVALADAIAREG